MPYYMPHSPSLKATPKKSFIYVRILAYLAEHPRSTKKEIFEEGLHREKMPFGDYTGNETLANLVLKNLVTWQKKSPSRKDPRRYKITPLGKLRLKAAI